MSEQLMDLRDIKGKTIRVAEASDGLVLAFTDGTYIRFEAEGSYHEHDAYIDVAYRDVDLGQKLRMGILTEDEWKRECDLERRNRQRETEAAEREEYERLKAKFG